MLIQVYLWVLTNTLKRLSSCASRLGPESLSTKIPEEKTNTCSASKMEDTRCWRQDEGSGKRTRERIENIIDRRDGGRVRMGGRWMKEKDRRMKCAWK